MRAGVSTWPIEFKAAIAACRTARLGVRRADWSSASNASESPICASAPAAGSASSGSLKPFDERGGRPAVADASECHGRCLPGVEILGRQLLDQQVNDAGPVPHQRFDHLRAHDRLPDQARQRALDSGPAQPSQDSRDPGQTVRTDTRDGVQETLRPHGH